MTTPEEKLLCAHQHAADWDGRNERRKENRNQLFDMIAELDAKMERVLGAIPDGDVEGHRRYHEAVMRSLERREKFRDAVIEKSLASLAWSILMGMGYAFWAYMKDHLK